jgi:isoleucyl-tRNA synthetase
MNQDYRSTLNLPKTAFSMKANLAQNEPKILEFWNKSDIYAKIRKKYSGKKKYILHDGPPYANGQIHIGHALNKTLKDIVVKFKTLQGFDSPFIPGWDCHGLPVEHQLFKELGIQKTEIEQVDFRKKAYSYALRFVEIQKEEFVRLGVFADWDKPYLTLDKVYEQIIVKSLSTLVKKGYIYRGLKPVNWCFRCETALAEAEVEYIDRNSPSVYVKFQILDLDKSLLQKIAGSKKIFAVVWTTTPWTLIANVAIAVHPNFKYSLVEANNEVWLIQEDLINSVMTKLELKDYSVISHIQGKELEGVNYKDIFDRPANTNLKFVLADYVSKEEGTGCVHTAPGHGQEDYITGQKYKLETVMPVDSKGKFFQDIAIDFKGQHVLKANQNIIDKLKGNGNLLYSGQISHSYAHCWRCKEPIIFRATEQWFMDVDKLNLRKKLLDCVNKKITWVPAEGQERISAMIALRPDWCLSRQRYWGVPIPAIVCQNCNKEFLVPEVMDNFAKVILELGTDAWFINDLKEFLPKAFKCPHCQNDLFKKGADIVDVWFESGVSSQAVLKTRESLEFPSQLYLEGSDQHRGWFQSSLIVSMAIDDKAPFETVLTHGFVVDGQGRKMSKSQGNVISPQEIIKEYGADILRLWVASSDYNFDVRISPEIISRLSESYRKIRNTLRFILGNLFDFCPSEINLDLDELSPIDRWVMFKLTELIEETTQHFNEFNFYKAHQEIYNFCTVLLSSFYLDVLKDLLYTSRSNSTKRRASQFVLYQILVNLTKLISPILSFTAEEVWQLIPEKNSESVFLSDWPQIDKKWTDTFLDKDFMRILEIRDSVLKALEEKRSQALIGSSLEAKVTLDLESSSDFKLLDKYRDYLNLIFITSWVTFKKSGKFNILVEKAAGDKCVRCWNYDESVGQDKENPLICSRCSQALK